MSREDHWNAVYTKKSADGVSWYTPHLERSLELIDGLELPPSATIIDVGGGASTLPEDLLARGYRHIDVLDISQEALRVGRERLGERAGDLRWIVGDVTTEALVPGRYDLWHDRAVFHFLTDAADRARYVAQVQRSLKPGGWIVMATFGVRGPEKCSGLPVQRYDEDSLTATLGEDFERLRFIEESHTTPWGSEQAFVYGLFRRARNPS